MWIPSLPCECEWVDSNPTCATFLFSFFLENNLSFYAGTIALDKQPIILKDFRRIVQKSKSRDHRAFLYKVVTQNIEYYSILKTIYRAFLYKRARARSATARGPRTEGKQSAATERLGPGSG